MTWMIIAILIGVALGAVLVGIQRWANKMTEAERREMEARLKAVPGFSASQVFVGVNGSTGIAIDEQRGELCLISRRQGELSWRVIPRQDILAVEVFEDGESVTRAVRSSQILTALVGKWAYGDDGAIIGGLSGKTRTEGRVNQIDVRLVVNDTAAPLHDLRFLNEDVPKGGLRYTDAMNKARHWAGVVKVLIERADKEERAPEVAAGRAEAHEAETHELPPQSPADSIAGELQKLADLHAAGALSDEEFRKAKARLLEPSAS
jgi:hypothetical protein